MLSGSVGSARLATLGRSVRLVRLAALGRSARLRRRPGRRPGRSASSAAHNRGSSSSSRTRSVKHRFKRIGSSRSSSSNSRHLFYILIKEKNKRTPKMICYSANDWTIL